MGQKMTYKGTIHSIGKVETYPSGFTTRTVVLRADDAKSKYPDYAVFEFTKGSAAGAKDATAILDGFREGDAVTVEFYLSAHESRLKPGRWFGSCRAVAMVRDGASAPVDLVPDVPSDGADGGIPF